MRDGSLLVAGRRRHPILERLQIVLVHHVRLFVPCLALGELSEEASMLLLRVVELGEPIGDLAAGDEQLEAVDESGLRIARSCQWRDLDRKARDERRLNHVPFGDRFGTLRSHVPTYTVLVERPRTLARIWPVVDEITAEHGVVTAALVPAYRERARGVEQGRLELISREALIRLARTDDYGELPEAGLR